MEDYIVRIYRRDGIDSQSVDGYVEKVETEQRQVFHSLDELAAIFATGMTEDKQQLPPRR